MTLRTRLLLAAGLLLGVVMLGAVVVLRTQQSYLIDQVDDQLRVARPLVRVPLDVLRDRPFVQPAPPIDAPISKLFIGSIDGDSLVTVLQGQLLTDIPDLAIESSTVQDHIGNGDPITVAGRTTDTRFRVALIQGTASEPISVVALPLDEIDSTVSRLRWTLGGVLAAVTVVLLIAMWWVHRHGLRPIARLTAISAAIAAGDGGQRVLGADRRTEAGQLATAFNVMLDQRDASDDQLRRFVADASHELRTPLTSIRGYLDLYREGGFRTPDSLDDMVRRMSQESNRMNQLVEDLLLLANLDQHRPLRQEPVDVGRLLRDAATDAAVLQPHRPITVSVVASEPLTITGDTFRLQQVISAIVANALAYTDTTAELRIQADTGPQATRISITDNGPGLPPHVADRVFDRFYRGDHSRARRTGGSGLGLAIAQSITHAHEGTIHLHTAPGCGCTFIITLPNRHQLEDHRTDLHDGKSQDLEPQPRGRAI